MAAFPETWLSADSQEDLSFNDMISVTSCKLRRAGCRKGSRYIHTPKDYRACTKSLQYGISPEDILGSGPYSNLFHTFSYILLGSEHWSEFWFSQQASHLTPVFSSINGMLYLGHIAHAHSTHVTLWPQSFHQPVAF